MSLLKPFSVFLASFLIFLFNVALSEQQIVRDSAKGVSYANFVRHKNRRLNTEQLESLTVQQHAGCGLKCLLNNKCTSMNYGGAGGHECQLLAANKFDSPEAMTSDESFEHFSVAVSEICARLKLFPTEF